MRVAARRLGVVRRLRRQLLWCSSAVAAFGGLGRAASAAQAAQALPKVVAHSGQCVLVLTAVLGKVGVFSFVFLALCVALWARHASS